MLAHRFRSVTTVHIGKSKALIFVILVTCFEVCGKTQDLYIGASDFQTQVTFMPEPLGVRY